MALGPFADEVTSCVMDNLFFYPKDYNYVEFDRVNVFFIEIELFLLELFVGVADPCPCLQEELRLTVDYQVSRASCGVDIRESQAKTAFLR